MKILLTLLTCAVCCSYFSAQELNTSQYEISHSRQLRFLRGEIPQYPPLALQARVSGKIKLKVIIKAGEVIRVESPTVTGATTILEQAAASNVRTWKFVTHSLETFEVTYDYQLSKSEVDEPQNAQIEMLLPVYVRIVADPLKPRTTY